LILKLLPSIDIKSKLFQHKWRGLGYSRNVVLNNAAGDYIVWVDDGTIISKGYVKQNVQFLEKNPDVGVTKGLIGEYSGSNNISTMENMLSLVFYHKHLGRFTTKMPGIGGSIYRVKAARKVGGFDERIRGANEDTDIAYRMILDGWRTYITHSNFLLTYNKNFKEVWIKNLWYGYGAHFNLHKHRKLRMILYKSTPIAGLFEGLLISKTAYKLTYNKLAFLLPIFLSLKRAAFCLGFIKSHLDSYGHSKN
jgi:GT2 family glycosyltransferase